MPWPARAVALGVALALAGQTGAKNLRACLSPDRFRALVAANRYPLKRGSVDAAPPMEPRLAVLLRGIYAWHNWMPASVHASRGPYDMDARATVPFLLENVVKPLRAAGTEADIFVAAPEVTPKHAAFAAQVRAWLKRVASVRDVWHFSEATSQYSYLARALQRLVNVAEARRAPYAAVLVARLDWLFAPTAHLLMRGNHEPGAIHMIAAFGNSKQSADFIALVPWRRIPLYASAVNATVRVGGTGAFPEPTPRDVPHSLHKLDGAILHSVSWWLAGCVRMNRCCNLFGFVHRGQSRRTVVSARCYRAAAAMVAAHQRGRASLNDSLVRADLWGRAPEMWGGRLGNHTMKWPLPPEDSSPRRFVCSPAGETKIVGAQGWND